MVGASNKAVSEMATDVTASPSTSAATGDSNGGLPVGPSPASMRRKVKEENVLWMKEIMNHRGWHCQLDG